MNGAELKARRERLGLSQGAVAERLRSTTASIRNWESEPTAIPPQAEMLWGVWEHRFQQEGVGFGPVTLIYTDGPMFVEPQGPQRPLAMMHREPFLTNAMALARACALWGQPGFESPLIMKYDGELLWNMPQLRRVVDMEDAGAPILPVMLRAIATHARMYSTRYVRTGARLPTAMEVEARQREIETEADKLAALADFDTRTSTDGGPSEEILDRLRKLGLTPPDDLVSGVAQAYVARRMPWPVS
jgi:hypothetical protein